MVFLQQPQIVIRAVQDQFMASKRIEQRFKIYFRERIHQHIPGNRADLNQANFFGISMQAIGFRIHRDPGCRVQLGKERGQLLFRINHPRNICLQGTPCQA